MPWAPVPGGVSREVVALADVARAWERQRVGAGTKLDLVP
jgi:hypothetical protein